VMALPEHHRLAFQRV